MSQGTNQPEHLYNAPLDQPLVGGASAKSFVASAEDSHLVDLLRNGDEQAFVMLIDRYHNTLLRLALMYVAIHSVAEEVVQETWLGVLKGLSRFEGRSSFKTWLFHILTNCAKTRAQREKRSVPFSSLTGDDPGQPEYAVEPDRFRGADQEWPGHWISFPSNWDDMPENRLLSQETRQHITAAIDMLPANQRAVVQLRDIEGWTAEETCNLLGISETNQRVLLHRGRSRVRKALEAYFDEEGK